MEDILFSPGKIGNLRIKNRLVRSACAERGANEDGSIGEAMIPFYEKLARGGAGLIITGFSYVHPSGRNGTTQTGIHCDEMMPGLKKMVDNFHATRTAAKIAMQIVHGGRQVRPYAVDEFVAPSPVSFGEMTPRELEEEEIWEIINAFVQAAVRVKSIGFDAVQFHAAHGFLISQFLSPYTNRRDDQWGGTPENRRRFFIEIIRRTREKTGPDFPLLAKMNCGDFLEQMDFTLEEAVETAIAAEAAGLDALEISGGILETPIEKGAVRPGIIKRNQEAYFLPQAKEIKKALTIPVIIVGGIRSAQVARKILEYGCADFISMGRPLIREPELPNKFKNGETTRAKCVSCNGCFINTGEILKCVMERGT